VTIRTDELKLTLVGCGAIAESYYLPALAKRRRVLEALTLVDVDIDRARKLAAAFGLKKYFADYRDVLDKTDGAIIALPIHLHHPISIEFLSRKIPVLCEKPLAESAPKAREMVGLAQKSGVALATNYSQRLWPHFSKVKAIIESRALGEPISIKYDIGEIFAWPTVSGFYFNSTGSARGILRDRGAHVLDHICWWLGGKPSVVRCQNDSFGGSDAVADVHFKYGRCQGEVMLSWLSSFPCTFAIEFERGSIEGEVHYPQTLLVTERGQRKRIKLRSELYSDLGDKIVDNFIKVIAKNEKPLVSGGEVLDSIGFVDDCYAVASRLEMPWYEIPEVNE